MINASANGWIKKYLTKVEYSSKVRLYSSRKLYKKIRKTGFVYGHTLSLLSKKQFNTTDWTEEELSKVALLEILYFIYIKETQDENKEEFVAKLVSFYSFDYKRQKAQLLFDKNVVALEKYLDERVQTNNNVVSKNFSHVVTNAFLFLDILAFQKYLEDGKVDTKYIKTIEFTILQIATLSLNQKNTLSKYDQLLIKLFENSVRYNKIDQIKTNDLSDLNLHQFTSLYERYYILDIATMTMWSDGLMETKERQFLLDIANHLDISETETQKGLQKLEDYIVINRLTISLFKYSNPVKHFYNQSSQTVQLLISRNKKRLLKELSQSGELVKLLAYSTQRDLSAAEKKKVKNQLLDICKTVPSLTIFLLPGGTLLLPILIKFIPKLLPSAFNENLDQDE